MIVEEEL